MGGKGSSPVTWTISHTHCGQKRRKIRTGTNSCAATKTATKKSVAEDEFSWRRGGTAAGTATLIIPLPLTESLQSWKYQKHSAASSSRLARLVITRSKKVGLRLGPGGGETYRSHISICAWPLVNIILVFAIVSVIVIVIVVTHIIRLSRRCY